MTTMHCSISQLAMHFPSVDLCTCSLLLAYTAMLQGHWSRTQHLPGFQLYLVQLVLLGQGNSFAPSQCLFVDECTDTPELHELVLLQLCCQAQLVKVVICGDAIP